MEIWQMRRAQLIPWDSTRPVPSVPLPPLTAFSEADLDAHAQRVRQIETAPPMVPEFPPGSWAIDRYGELYQLRFYRLDDPVLWFPEGDPFGRFRPWNVRRHPEVIEKYLGWLSAGYEPPPLTGIESEKRRIKIQEGHHRAETLVRAGRSVSLIWVSPVALLPSGYGTGLTHQVAVEQALREEKPIPREVLADYAHLSAFSHSAYKKGQLYSWQ